MASGPPPRAKVEITSAAPMRTSAVDSARVAPRWTWRGVGTARCYAAEGA